MGLAADSYPKKKNRAKQIVKYALGKNKEVIVFRRRSGDEVHHPAHYNRGEIECLEFIEDQGHGKSFTVGSAMKYITRAGAKGDELEDLRKAAWYLQRRIEQVKAEREKRKPCRPNDMPKVPV